MLQNSCRVPENRVGEVKTVSEACKTLRNAETAVMREQSSWRLDEGFVAEKGSEPRTKILQRELMEGDRTRDCELVVNLPCTHICGLTQKTGVLRRSSTPVLAASPLPPSNGKEQ